jgi:hypothetical protein
MGDVGQRGFGIVFNGSTTVYGQIAGSSSAIYGTSGSDTHSTTTWTTYALVFIPSTGVYLYKNGAMLQNNTSSPPSSQYQNSSPLVIGSNGGLSGFFNGYIDNVSLYNTHLSACLIAEQYRNPYQLLIPPEPQVTVIDLGRYKEIKPESRIAFDNGEVAPAASNPII